MSQTDNQNQSMGHVPGTLMGHIPRQLISHVPVYNSIHISHISPHSNRRTEWLLRSQILNVSVDEITVHEICPRNYITRIGNGCQDPIHIPTRIDTFFTRDMTHLCWHEKWLISTRDMTQSFISTRDMTHSSHQAWLIHIHTRHDLFMFTRDMTHI